MSPSPPLSALRLTPTGHLVLTDTSRLDPELAARLAAPFAAGAGPALLHLASRELDSTLPAELAFFRSLATRVVGAACRLPGLDQPGIPLELPADTDGLDALRLSAPPFEGAEYLSRTVLGLLWDEAVAALGERISASGTPASEVLAGLHPSWHATGRVHFHLAEKKGDPDKPFAFLATYSTRVGASGKLQHKPLSEALKEHAGKPEALTRLLVPVQAASDASPLVARLVASRELFHPLGWTADQALAFLRELPAIEAGGVVVRVPGWWKAGKGARPSVRVSVGGREPSRVGLEALLDFEVEVTLGGERLTKKELAEILRARDGLTLLKGKWVELDRGELRKVLDHWQAIEARAAGGVSLAEAMRLLAGADLSAQGEATEEGGESWTERVAGPWLAEVLAALRSPEGSKPPDPGADFRATLRGYQQAGLAWLWKLDLLGLGGCLADDMGLGKTVQVLALLAAAKARHPGRTTLLVVPASLVANWASEAARFAPGLSVRVLHPSSQPSRELAKLGVEDLAGADLLVTTYGYLHRLAVLAEMDLDRVVLDEAQAIKNPGTRVVKAVKQLRARTRLALTGTPIENRVGDLWSIFDFVNPGLLGSQARFGAFAKHAAQRPDGYAPLRRLIAPYVLRRLKTDRSVAPDLPDKTEMVAWCPLTKVQAALYTEAVEGLTRKLHGLDGIERRGAILKLLVCLKQICDHPSLWLGDGRFEPGESGKLARVAELVEELAERQEKLLVFTQFREMCGPLDRFLAAAIRPPGLVQTGEPPVKARGELVRRFQEDEAVPYFVLSLKAGGTGLNLTAASQVLHFDRWWNPAVEDQATDRAFRIGQTRNVLVHKLACRGTVEERIDALIRDKRRLSAEVLGAGAETALTEMGDAELLAMVKLDLDAAMGEG